jgi:hypothetical protein
MTSLMFSVSVAQDRRTTLTIIPQKNFSVHQEETKMILVPVAAARVNLHDLICAYMRLTPVPSFPSKRNRKWSQCLQRSSLLSEASVL